MRSSTPCVMIIAAVLLVTASTFAQQASRDLYQRARMLEETGQTAEAIKVYGQVVSEATKAGNRALAAKAQFRIGVLHKRRGRIAESQRAFQTVVGQFADQPEVARRAQAKLAATEIGGKVKPVLIVKRSGPSPDGQFLASLIFPEKLPLSPAAFDLRRQRLYLVTKQSEPAEPKQKLHIGQRQVSSLVYSPSTLVVIDAKTQRVFKTVPFPVYLGEIAYNPTSDKLYANAAVDGHVRVIDPDTFTTTARIRVPGYPGMYVHCINPITNKIYIGSQGFAGNDKLFVIDGASNALSGPFDLGGLAGAPIVDEGTNRIYVTVDDRTRVFRGEDNSVLADLPNINVSLVDPVRNRVYAQTTRRGQGNDLVVIDGNTHATIATFPYNDRTENIALDPTTNRLYVPLAFKNQLAVIDTTTLTEINKVRFAGYPKHVTVDPVSGTVYFYAGEDLALRVVSREKLEPEAVSEEFFDEFDEPELNSEWAVLKGSGNYSLNERSGSLRFHTAVPEGSSRLMLTRKFRGADWTLETKVSYFTGITGGARDLWCKIFFGSLPLSNQREPDGLVISRTRDSWNNCCPGAILVDFLDNGIHGSFGPPAPLNPSESYYWRIKRTANTVTVETSADGVTFMVVGSHVFGSQIEGLIQYLSIGFNSHANGDAFADYDYVRLKKN
ncbi:MAG TPA: tetratricopeptide repeat protein [Pyrinomonadaceae bacterium]|nr:tetratricopeptide repeat protein [Pyrinomonadaceae bacterium]